MKKNIIWLSSPQMIFYFSMVSIAGIATGYYLKHLLCHSEEDYFSSVVQATPLSVDHFVAFIAGYCVGYLAGIL